MSEFQPLTGRKAIVATRLQDVVGGVPKIDAPNKVINIAGFTTSDLDPGDMKMKSDALEDRASESDGYDIGTLEPSGSLEFQAQEDGSTLDMMAMTCGNPTVTDTAADAVNHLAAFHTHLFPVTNAYRFGTIVEHVGASHFVYWGARVNTLSMGVAKRANQLVRLQSQIMALNTYNNKGATAGTQTGLSTAAKSGNPYYSPVRAMLKRENTLWTGAREFNININWNLDRADDLDGTRGMAPYAPDGSVIEVTVAVFFSTEAEHRRFLGELDVDADAYGATESVIEEDVELIIPGPLRGAEDTDDLFRPEIAVGILRSVCTVYKATKTQGGIIQNLTLKPNHNQLLGYDAYLRVKNQIPGTYYTGAGTPMAGILANAGSAFVSP